MGLGLGLFIVKTGWRTSSTVVLAKEWLAQAGLVFVMSVDPRSQCPIASSLDLLGDRWSLVVMRDVLFGLRHSFSEIGADEGIATNVLTERLDRLVDAKILQRRSHPEDGRRRVYLPTERGIDLIPLLLELVVWGQAHTSAPGPAGLLKAIRGDRDAVIRDFKARARASLKRPA